MPFIDCPENKAAAIVLTSAIEPCLGVAGEPTSSASLDAGTVNPVTIKSCI